MNRLFGSSLAYLHARAAKAGPEAAADGIVAGGLGMLAPQDAARRVRATDDPSQLNAMLMEILSSEGAGETFRQLSLESMPDGTTLLEKLVPELKGKLIVQDQTYHRGETVLDHLIESVSVIDRLIARDPDTFGKYARLLRLVALLHDVGKHDDPSGPKEGRREVVADSGKIRFLGHAPYGARLFEDIVRNRINPSLPPALRIGEKDIVLARHLIEMHMEGINLLQSTSGQPVSGNALKRYVDKLCFQSKDVLRRGVPIEDIMRLSLLINEMDIMAAANYEDKERKAAAFRQIADGIVAKLPSIKQELIARGTKPFVTGEDIASLGIEGRDIGTVASALFDLQIYGTDLNRESALDSLAEIATRQFGIAVPEGWKASRLSEGIGAPTRLVRREIAVRRAIKDNRGDVAATVTIYKPIAEIQFSGGVEIEALGKLLESGMYPDLQGMISDGMITVQDVHEALTSKGIPNLDVLTSTALHVSLEGRTIRDLGGTPNAPTERLIEIEREVGGRPLRIVIESGWQGGEEHVGEGGFHIGSQRLSDLLASFKKPGETLEDALSRFIEGIIVACTRGTVEIPSNRDGNMSFIIDSINGGGQFIAVLVDKTNPGEWKIVTTLYQPDAEKMRRRIAKNLLTQLRTKPEGRPPLTDAEFDVVLRAVNAFLTARGVEQITVDMLYSLKGRDGNGEALIRQEIEAKGYRGKEANKKFADIQKRAESVPEALDMVAALPNK